jgi:uncharacterized protein YndB with AHSA1/START domain
MNQMTLRVTTSAPLAVVRAALTDATALETWLAERAEVDLPHTFAFWGRHTPDGDAPSQRLLHADDHTLRFEWDLHDTITTVEVALSENDGGTTISLAQSHVPELAEVVTNSTPLAILGTFWSLAIANLVDHVEARETTPKCDFTEKEALRAQVTVAAAPEQVYASLMEPDLFQKWFLATISVEPHVGGRWAMGDDFEDENSTARIVDLQPGRRVELDWGNLVSTWELEGADGRTRLTFVNSGFDGGNPPYADWTGWLSGLAGLRRFYEIPGYQPIWESVDWPGMDGGVLANDRP